MEMLIPLCVGVISAVLFLFFQAQGIYTGDSGDLVTAAVTHGVAHPPGYPLYAFLGWLAAQIHILTPAWRVSLLSSIPSALSLVVLYLLVYRLTRDRFAAVIAAFMLVGNYVFFLYSVTAEVFGLFNLFILSLFYTLLRWQETKHVRYLYIFSVLFGLALTHQHVILFMAPAMAFFVWRNIDIIPGKKRIRAAAYSIVCFLLGLIPYLYAPIAASSDPIINWDRPVTWMGFWRLLTRADYGTFVSNTSFGQSLVQRLLSVKAYGNFILLDLGLVGILLAVVGGIALWRQKSKVSLFFLLALLFFGPAFFFYASFPLVGRFTLATYERFLFPTYTILAILIGIGTHQLFEWIKYLIKQRMSSGLIKVTTLLVRGCLLVVPLTLLFITLWRFWGLSTDRTADNLGRDILASAPPNSIVILYQDTPLFTTQYVRYGLQVRPDIVLLHGSRLTQTDYHAVIAKNFPGVQLPSATSSQFLWDFLEQNAKKRPVLSNVALPLKKSWYWVPRGLLYELVSETSLPPLEQTIATNISLWNSFHDPRKGILDRYMHLMLADVLDVYASFHIALGKTMARGGRTADAATQFSFAAALGGDANTADAFVLLGIMKLETSDCDGALSAFDEAKQRKFVVDETLLLVQSITFRDCVKDAVRADELYSQYELLKRRSEQPLDQL